MSAKNLYFHNGGLYGIPHFIGAVRELIKEKQTNYIYYGNSAGASFSLVCYLVLNGYLDLNYLRTEVDKVLVKSRTTSTILTPLQFELIDIILPFWPVDLAQQVSGILNVGVTTKAGHKFVNQFATNADIYNALICSGTIALCSNYESMIDGEVCLDGGYTFNEQLIPKDTIIIASDILVLLSLTIPPAPIRPLLESNGRRNVKRGLERPLTIYNIKPDEMDVWFQLHSFIPKDLNWASHIENMTRS